jgi:hypothetical protein
MADGVGHGGANADRRELHHELREAEHDVGQRLAPLNDRPCLFADRGHRQREQDGEDDDLQHVAVGHGL